MIILDRKEDFDQLKARQCRLHYPLKLDRKTLEKLYMSFIRSKLEYGGIIWDNCSQEQSDMIENVQLRAAKIVSGAIRRTHTELLYSELCWEPLQVRRHKQRLTTMYKIKNNDAPTYLCNTLPDTVAHTTDYNLRNRDDVSMFKTRTKTFQLSFFPRTVNEWNRLTKEQKESPNALAFRDKLDPVAKTPPPWYLVGSRKMSVAHAKLRMLCSQLNDHLYSHIHVIDSPQCSCGNARENNRHFLLQCPLYHQERQVLLADLHKLNFTPSLNNLLYGDSNMSDLTNSRAVEIIHKYFVATKRFQ